MALAGQQGGGARHIISCCVATSDRWSTGALKSCWYTHEFTHTGAKEDLKRRCFLPLKRHSLEKKLLRKIEPRAEVMWDPLRKGSNRFHYPLGRLLLRRKRSCLTIRRSAVPSPASLDHLLKCLQDTSPHISPDASIDVWMCAIEKKSTTQPITMYRLGSAVQVWVWISECDLSCKKALWVFK